jgi:hypothetical protein
MKTVIDRGLLTDLLLEALEPEAGDPRQWLVGDHEKPKDGGWQGDPGQSDWVPYVVLTATPSQPPTGDIATPTSDVWFGYAITAVGSSRGGADKIAAAARERLATVARQKTSDGRTISQVRMMRYGGIERVPANPTLYLVTDQISVWTTK